MAKYNNKASTPIDSKDLNAKGEGYLTKRIVVAKAKDAGREAAEAAMKVMGYVVTVDGENIIRKNADGSVIIVGKID